MQKKLNRKLVAAKSFLLQPRVRQELGLWTSMLVLILATLVARSVFDKGTHAANAASTLAAEQSRVVATELSKGFATISKQVEGAIVNINTEQVVQNPALTGPEDFFRRFFGDEFSSGRGRPRTQRSLGSGFVVDSTGYILTNEHVVDRATRIKVKFPDGRSLDAKIVGTDSQTDLAVLKVTGTNLKALPLGDSGKMEVGDWVLAFGSPFGLDKTMTAGIISAKGRVIGAGNYDDFLQTDAAINPGNSGGPLVNLRGEAVGINTVIFSRSGGFEGVGFAIPSDLAGSVYGQLVKSGKVTRGFLGVQIQELTPELARSFNLKEARGVLIAEVEPNGPADKAGVKSGDILMEYNSQPIKTPRDLTFAVAATQVGLPSKVKVLRQGRELTLDVKVGERPVETAEGFQIPRSEEHAAQGKLGITVANVTPEAARQLGLSNTEGALVTEVSPGGAADEGGVRPGDLILEINRTAVKNGTDLTNVARGLKSGSNVLLKVVRQGRTLYLAFAAS